MNPTNANIRANSWIEISKYITNNQKKSILFKKKRVSVLFPMFGCSMTKNPNKTKTTAIKKKQKTVATYR